MRNMFDRLFCRFLLRFLSWYFAKFLSRFFAGSFSASVQVPFSGSISKTMFGCDESGIGKRKQAAAAQYHITSHRRELGVDYEIFLQVLLQRFYVIQVEEYTNSFAEDPQEVLHQTLVCLTVGFTSSVKFLHIFAREGFHLVKWQLGAECLFGFARGNKHNQLFALLAGCETGKSEGFEVSGGDFIDTVGTGQDKDQIRKIFFLSSFICSLYPSEESPPA